MWKVLPPNLSGGDSGNQETLFWQKIHAFFCYRYTSLPCNVNAFLVILPVLYGPTWLEFSARYNPIFLLRNYDFEEIVAVKTMIYRRDKTILQVHCMLFFLIS